jgi:hypothetical protein
VILDQAIPDGGDSNPVLDELKSLDCSYEGMNRRYFAVNIPPTLELNDVCDAVTRSGQQWEHADPTYAELHPEEGAG